MAISVCVLALSGLGCTPYRLYWGDVHGHTNISDGNCDLDTFLTRARDGARLDFVITTDHDFGNAPPWRMPPEAWRRTQEAADAYTVDGVFVAIAGYEWTSQPKYWSEYAGPGPSERLFDGPAKHYNHKNVYFPGRVAAIFRANDPAYRSPDLLAAAVQAAGGLIHNNHPSVGADGADQWAYDPAYSAVIANTEMAPDTVRYHGQTYDIGVEQTVRAFLNRGGRTGFVGGSDTHDCRPQARTAVFARGLSRDAIFEALRHRRNYAVSGARIVLDFRIEGHRMGEEITVAGRPRLHVDVRGTDRIEEVVIIRNGVPLYSVTPGGSTAKFNYVDDPVDAESYYYVRVTQGDADENGNPSRAWSSPIWVRRR